MLYSKLMTKDKLDLCPQDNMILGLNVEKGDIIPVEIFVSTT